MVVTVHDDTNASTAARGEEIVGVLHRSIENEISAADIPVSVHQNNNTSPDNSCHVIGRTMERQNETTATRYNCCRSCQLLRENPSIKVLDSDTQQFCTFSCNQRECHTADTNNNEKYPTRNSMNRLISVNLETPLKKEGLRMTFTANHHHAKGPEAGSPLVYVIKQEKTGTV